MLSLTIAVMAAPCGHYYEPGPNAYQGRGWRRDALMLHVFGPQAVAGAGMLRFCEASLIYALSSVPLKLAHACGVLSLALGQ